MLPHTIGHRIPISAPAMITLEFTRENLKEYYKSIRNNPNISDGFKLKIANTILDI